jgi:F-type H+-transporting ATPase subunit a
MSEISLRAEEIFRVGSYAVTNSLLLATLSLVVLAALGLALKRRLAMVPGMFQNAFETALDALLGLMDSVLGDRKKSEKYLPLVATIFLFILFSNWLGLLPGVGSVIVHEGTRTVPLLRSPASDLNFTLALAIVAVLSINILGVAAIGAVKHATKFFNFKGPIEFFVGILELVSEFAKMISFSFRLFGNVFAGEVLLTIVGFLVPYVVPLPFLFLELFVGLIQAFIFSMLTLVFVAAAVTEHGGER